MSLLENLPVDVHSPSEHEENVMNMLFHDEKDGGNESSNGSTKRKYPILQGFEEGLAIVGLFLIFSTPYITDYIQQLPFMSMSPVMEYIVKIVLILISYGIIKKYYL